MPRPNTNTYESVGNTVEIHTAHGDVILIDAVDFENVKQRCWCVETKGYARSGKERLHRFIMHPPKGLQVDHINRNKLDNRRCNLRIVTNQQNHFNRPVNKNNTSGVTGVSYNKAAKKWACQISLNGRCKFSGLFDTKEEAIAKRKSLEAIYFNIERK